jgi:hypothetical protein
MGHQISGTKTYTYGTGIHAPAHWVNTDSLWNRISQPVPSYFNRRVVTNNLANMIRLDTENDTNSACVDNPHDKGIDDVDLVTITP